MFKVKGLASISQKTLCINHLSREKRQFKLILDKLTHELLPSYFRAL